MANMPPGAEMCRKDWAQNQDGKMPSNHPNFLSTKPTKLSAFSLFLLSVESRSRMRTTARIHLPSEEIALHLSRCKGGPRGSQSYISTNLGLAQLRFEAMT